MKELPEDYKDAICVNTDVHISFIDRLKILFGWRFSLRSVSFCEVSPGKVFTESEVRIYRNKKPHVCFQAEERRII